MGMHVGVNMDFLLTKTQVKQRCQVAHKYSCCCCYCFCHFPRSGSSTPFLVEIIPIVRGREAELINDLAIRESIERSNKSVSLSLY